MSKTVSYHLRPKKGNKCDGRRSKGKKNLDVLSSHQGAIFLIQHKIMTDLLLFIAIFIFLFCFYCFIQGDVRC